MLVDVAILLIASTFDLSQQMSVFPIKNPKYDTCFLKTHTSKP